MTPNPPAPCWVPNTNVVVNVAGELVIKVELAAMKFEDIQIATHGQRLTVSGERHDPDHRGAQILVLEVHHGRFESFLDVPEEFDLCRARTDYQNGMLRMTVPRREPT